MKKVNFRQFLTPQDRLDISFTQDRGKILLFSVNYSALFDGRWRYIMRVDNCHDGVAHRHTYHLHRKQFRVVLGEEDNNLVFTKFKRHIIANFQRIKENYLRVRPKT